MNKSQEVEFGFNPELIKINYSEVSNSALLKYGDLEDVFDESLLKDMNRKEKISKLVVAIESKNIKAVDVLIKAGAWSSNKTKIDDKENVSIFDLVMKNYSDELIAVMPEKIPFFSDYISDNITPAVIKDFNSIKWVADKLIASDFEVITQFYYYVNSYLYGLSVNKDFVKENIKDVQGFSDSMLYCVDSFDKKVNNYKINHDDERFPNHKHEMTRLKINIALLLTDFGFYNDAVEICKNDIDVSKDLVAMLFSLTGRFNLKPSCIVLVDELFKNIDSFEKPYAEAIKNTLVKARNSFKSAYFSLAWLRDGNTDILNSIFPNIEGSSENIKNLTTAKNLSEIHFKLSNSLNNNEIFLSSVIIKNGESLHLMLKTDGVKEKIIDLLKSNQPLMLFFIKNTTKTQMTDFFSKNKDSFKDWKDKDGHGLSDYFYWCSISDNSYNRFEISKQILNTLIYIDPNGLIEPPAQGLEPLISTITNDATRSFIEKRLINKSIMVKGSKKTKIIKF